jgi:hypothetical protein
MRNSRIYGFGGTQLKIQTNLQMRSQAGTSCSRFLRRCVSECINFQILKHKTKHSRIAVRIGSSFHSLFRTYSCIIIILWFNPQLHPQVLCLLLLFVLSHVYTTHSKSQSRVHRIIGQIHPRCWLQNRRSLFSYKFCT